MLQQSFVQPRHYHVWGQIYTIKIHFISYSLNLDLTSSPFSLRFTNQNFVCTSNSSRECYMRLPFQSLSCDHLMTLLANSRYYGDPQHAYAVFHILLYLSWTQSVIIRSERGLSVLWKGIMARLPVGVDVSSPKPPVRLWKTPSLLLSTSRG